MIRQIFKMIWSQWRGNGWIFAELLIVTGVLWIMLDGILVKSRVYYSPMGHDITNTYILNLSNLGPNSPGYVPAEALSSTQTDDLLQLMNRLRNLPEVDEVCASYYSCPYSYGDSWGAIFPVGDTTTVEKSYHIRRVTPEYFTVFRVKDKHGNPILHESISGNPYQILITEDLEQKMFGNAESINKKLTYGEEQGPEYTVINVCQPIRDLDYETSTPCFFEIMTPVVLDRNVNQFNAASAELVVRMKQYKATSEMYDYLAGISSLLTVNNLNVHGVTPMKERRAQLLAEQNRQVKIQIILLVFIMINVFFGIIGTFWVRTQYRKGEMGLRIAMGSTRKGIYRFMNMEGMCLLILTVPLFLFFVGNSLYFRLFLEELLPGSFLRYLSSIGGTYLLIAGMICLGIFFPARKAVNIQPAEALHYE